MSIIRNSSSHPESLNGKIQTKVKVTDNFAIFKKNILKFKRPSVNNIFIWDIAKGINRSSRPEVFCKKGVLTFRKIHRKTLAPESLF